MIMVKWYVIFTNGVHKSLIGYSEEDIRSRYDNVKTVRKMETKENT